MTLYQRFNRFLETYAPEGLYRRAMLILIAPALLLQLIMAGLVLERYWDNASKILGQSLAREIGLLVTLYEQSEKTDADLKRIAELAENRLRYKLTVIRGQQLPSIDDFSMTSFFENKMQRYLDEETSRPFYFENYFDEGRFEVQVEVEPGLIFQVLTDADRARTTDTETILLLMLGSTLLLTGIAAIFLRNQIRPILSLAKAAQDFGLGRDTTGFKPGGATEVRQAGEAFIDMRRRIARHVEQRTAMLAGVSHDLRTILTRFRLELAVLGDNPKIHPLKEDVDEMQHMLEDYMAFVRGDGGEQAVPVSIPDAVASTIEMVERERPDSDARVVSKGLPGQPMMLKPNAFRRLLSNLVSNAVRYGRRVEISGEVIDGRLWLYVDDDGPGIPAAEREHAFRPFVRLDNARNLDETGTGLGLAIALDIAHAHGGDIVLEDSPLGGLRAAVKLPI